MQSGDISFEDNNAYHIKSRVILGAPETPKMISFLTSKGIVKTERGGMFLLLVSAAVFFILAVFVFLKYNTEVFNSNAKIDADISSRFDKNGKIIK